MKGRIFWLSLVIVLNNSYTTLPPLNFLASTIHHLSLVFFNICEIGVVIGWFYVSLEIEGLRAIRRDRRAVGNPCHRYKIYSDKWIR